MLELRLDLLIAEEPDLFFADLMSDYYYLGQFLIIKDEKSIVFLQSSLFGLEMIGQADLMVFLAKAY